MSGGWLSGLLRTLGAGAVAAPDQAAAAQGASWLFGASHIAALRRAQEERIAKGRGPAAIRNMKIASLGASRVSKAQFHRVTQGRVGFLDAGYQRNFDTSGIGGAIAPGDRVGVQMGDANGILLDHGGYWADHAPAALCQKGTISVPQTTLKAICDAESAPVRAFMKDLQDLGFRLYWVPHPPIKEDHPMFAAGVRPEVITALDTLFLKRITTAMTAMGIPVVPRPAAGTTAQGLLPRAFSQRETGTGTVDWVHANPAYGDLMLDEIARII
tara:strand:+ start:367 stop:1179 length:813 start_codon:yes stop_codon:yes gene_type:complete